MCFRTDITSKLALHQANVDVIRFKTDIDVIRFEIDVATCVALFLTNSLHLNPFWKCPRIIKNTLFGYSEKILIVSLTSELMNIISLNKISIFFTFDMCLIHC